MQIIPQKPKKCSNCNLMLTSEPPQEEEKSIFSKRLETAINQIFSITTRKSRKKALSIKMKQTPDPLEKKLLKQEFLMRESVTSMKKTQKMSIDDFEVLKIIGILTLM